MLGRPVIRWAVFVPAFVVLLLGGSFTVYYSWRVTGSPTKIPYVVNRETYGWPENLAILPPQKVIYRHVNLESMHRLELSHREAYSTWVRMLESWRDRFVIVWEFFVGPALMLPFLILPWTLRNPRLRAIFLIALCMWGLNFLQLMAYPQHVAPEAGIFFLLLVSGLRHLYVLAKRLRLQPERLIASIVLCLAC
ncbi:MAG: hypothetical protein M3Z32_07465, partial [Acidobacteriota bacterium]|nr:hypothetical protein [Acidobacteriota bacterium]